MNDFGFIAVVIAVSALMVGIIIACAVVSVRELYAQAGAFDSLKLAYVMSQEDRLSLSREELKATYRMSHDELTAFVAEKFPNTVPQIDLSSVA